MTLAPLAAHGLCLTIVLGDLLARAVRLRWYLRGLGTELPLRHAGIAIAWGDAAAGLTPLRFGGEAAKFAGLLRAGVRPPTGLLALGLEAVVTYPLVAAFGLILAWRFAPTWWAQTEPLIRTAVAAGWPWLVGILVFSLAGVVFAVRWHHLVDAEAGGIRPRLAEALRRVPAWAIGAGIPLSLYNIVGRTAVLPLLALTLPEHPPFGVLLLGSFALLYSQLVLPTPAGAGAVDLGFLAGVAGNLGSGAAGLLLAWRFYTVVLGAMLGVGLALHTVGWAALRRMVASVRGGSVRGR
jgi:uncharacterized membrane protein YbhN (UPF0104 family)